MVVLEAGVGVFNNKTTRHSNPAGARLVSETLQKAEPSGAQESMTLTRDPLEPSTTFAVRSMVSPRWPITSA